MRCLRLYGSARALEEVVKPKIKQKGQRNTRFILIRNIQTREVEHIITVKKREINLMLDIWRARMMNNPDVIVERSM